MIEKDYWEDRFDTLFPNGLTQEQVNEANDNMWKTDAQSSTEPDNKPEPILIVKQK